MTLLFSYDLLAKSNTLTADTHSIRANAQVLHLSLFFATERAAQSFLLLEFLGLFATCSYTFVTYINHAGSGNEALYLVLMFNAKGTNVYLSPSSSHHDIHFPVLSLILKMPGYC